MDAAMIIGFRALIACNEFETRQFLLGLIGIYDLRPTVARNTHDAVRILHSGTVFYVFCQDNLPGDGLGTILREAYKVAVPVVVCSRLDSSQPRQNWLRALSYESYSPPPFHSTGSTRPSVAPIRRFPPAPANSGPRTLEAE